MRLRLLALAAPLLAVAFATVSAQVESNLPDAGFGTPAADGKPVNPATPTIHVYSRETVLDILATDDKGQPVTGLKQSDFTVLEDSHPQPIRSFAEHTVTGPPPAPRPLPPHTYTNSQALPANGPVQIFYFILPPPIEPSMSMTLGPDPAINRGAIIVRAKKYIADYCRTMPAGTQVAIFSFVPGEGLHLVQGFTTDGPRAAAAIDKITVQRMMVPNSVISDPIAAADQIAAYVAGIHGRKNLIWIAPVPLLITHDGGYSDPGKAPDMTHVNRLRDTFDKFTQEQIAIYPLDPNGVHGLGMGALMAQLVADETGGATSNSNDYKGDIAKIVAETSHFYTLSYVPTRPDQDGHFHPVTIKVSRPGVHLRYRTGYNDEQPHQPDPVLAQHMIQGPMRLGAIPTTQLAFDLQVQPTPPSNSASYAAAEASLKTVKDEKAKPGKGTPYDVVFRFDPTQIAFAQAANGTRTANVEFDLGAYDPYSNLVIARSQVVKLALTPAEYEEFVRTTYRFYLPIPLPAGQLTLRAGLFDTVGNTSGSFELPLTVSKPAK